MDTREAVTDMLIEILDHEKPCHKVCNRILSDQKEWTKTERAFTTRLCEGTIERLLTIDYLIEHIADRSMDKIKPFIRALLRMSCYQLVYMNGTPDSAVCNEAVKLAKKRGFSGLSGFVNGVLRNIARKKENLMAFSEPMPRLKRLSIQYSVPVWLIEQWEQDFDMGTAEGILNALYKDTDTTIRYNKSKGSKEELIELLKKEAVTVEEGFYCDEALRITKYDSLERLMAFQRGLFTVQDESSMICGLAAGVKADSIVLDICAAPGGKTLHMADIMNGLPNVMGRIEARDLSEYKISLIRENLKKCSFQNVNMKVQDALVFDSEMEDKADIVVADLPCSGTGVIGKKPDIKYKMTHKQQKELCLLQQDILRNAVRYVKPGGTLVFSTCTLNKEENDSNRIFIIEELGLVPDSLEPYLPHKLLESKDITATASEGYIRMIPGQQESDGFYVSRYRKHL